MTKCTNCKGKGYTEILIRYKPNLNPIAPGFYKVQCAICKGKGII